MNSISANPALSEGCRWIYDVFSSYCEPKVKRPIDVWVDEEVFYLPSNTAEPGPYDLSRAPYQRDILRALSPDHPARTVVLVFGSQMGKTTIENITMDYYIVEDPSPIGFAFSDIDNLKNYVKNKFDPMLYANPKIKNVLKSEGKTSADTLTSKQFPGGFLKFLSGKSEASMRSDSLRIVIADELDTMGITKGGDVKSLLEKRVNTFWDTAKICLSSTPLNESLISKYLEMSTYCKYYMQCPHCGEYMTFELDYLRWDAVGDGVVMNAWMECPNCHQRIFNEDKISMMKPENGAKWVATNLDADPTYYGFYLPSFYAPVGWISWKNIAQEYVTAAFTSKGVDHEMMTAFFNTIIAKPYQIGSTSAQDWRILFEKALQSEYTRQHVPNWVNIITTGADVQKNRIEVSVYGWGKLGKSLAIDHIVIPVADNELDIPTSEAWMEYTMYTLDYVWEREDGLPLKSVANAIDSSYKPDNVYAYQVSLPKDHRNRLFPVKGRDSLPGFMPFRKSVKSESLSDAYYLDVPVNSLKQHLFDHLAETTREKADKTKPFFMEYPNDFSQEYYQQLYSEVYVRDGKRWIWKKIRDRNEILDCTVYNLAMFYHMGFGNLTAEDWDGLANSQEEYMKSETNRQIKKMPKRKYSKGYKL